MAQIGTRITYVAAGGGADVATAVAYILRAQQLLLQAKGLMNSVSSGGTVNANLETSGDFGVAAGQGSVFYTAVNNMQANLAAITTAAVSDLLINRA